MGTKRRFHRVEGAADKFRFQSFVLVTCVVPGSHHALRRLLDAESRPNSRQCQTRCPMAPRLANQIYRKTALSVQRQAGCPHRQPREWNLRPSVIRLEGQWRFGRNRAWLEAEKNAEMKGGRFLLAPRTARSRD